MSTTPSVSVVIPARNEEASIEACLASIQAQDTTEPLEIIVIDGGSADRTSQILARVQAEDPRVRTLVNPGGEIPVSLNLGLAAARGRWLVRIDAHSTVQSDYVRVLTGHLASGRWGGVGGRKDADARTATGRSIALALGSPAGVGGSAYHWAERPQRTDHVPFGAYSVALLRDLDGWDEHLQANEDYEMDLRIREAGYDLLLDPSVRIRWRCKETLGGLFRQYRRYGRGKADVARKHPGTLAARHMAGPALVAGLTLCVVIAPFAPSLAMLLTAPYVIGVVVAGAWIGVRAGHPAWSPRIAAALFTMHSAWGLGFWQGRLLGVRSTQRSVMTSQSPAGPTT